MTRSRSEGVAHAARPYAILFVCTHNSARSLMAEAILNRRAFRLDRIPRFRAFSAGAHPAAAPHPLALETLKGFGYTAAFAKPQNWKDFSRPHAPDVDLILQLCEPWPSLTAPRLPTNPLTAYWPTPDPAAAPGGPEARRAAFRDAFRLLERRIDALLAEDDRAGPLREAGAAVVMDRLDAIARLGTTLPDRITL